MAILAAVTAAALAALRSTTVPGWERVALVLFVTELSGLAASIWAGHADLRSMAEVYLFAVLVLLGSGRGLGRLALCASAAAVVAAAHQALYL